jgi:magnesium chelatase family protein
MGNYTFPANFMLIGAMNPCPCGCYPDLDRCTCTPVQIQQYLGKVSQPFLDRMDLCIEAPKVKYEMLINGCREEESMDIRERVCRARDIQNKRYEKLKITTNSMMSVNELEQYCILGGREKRLIKQAFSSLGLTARAYHKILKVSRTIADLDGDMIIGEKHLKEAIAYRTIDKKYWGR